MDWDMEVGAELASENRKLRAQLAARPDLTCEECESILPAIEDMAGVVSGFAPDVRARYPDFAAIAARLREAILRG